MNALEQFYKDLDKSDWDVEEESSINKFLIETINKLSEDALSELMHYAEIERQVFHLTKTPDKGLSFRTSGTKKLADGKEIPFEWPDIKQFKKKDFDYILDRFKSTKNIYSKTEYGLVLYYSNNIKDNQFVLELIEALFELFKSYLKKSKNDTQKDYLLLNSIPVIYNALYIANNRKSDAKILNVFHEIIKYIFRFYEDWELSDRATLRIIIDFTEIAVKYFKDFNETVDVNKFLDKNWSAAQILSSSYVWGAIYIADSSIKLARKLHSEINNWIYFKAELYEKLADQRKGDLASLTFIEKAMSIYKKLKDQENLKRLQNIYQELRTSFNLGEVREELPQDETQRLIQFIKKDVNEKSEEDIVKTLLLTPMIRQIDDIKKISDESFKETLLLNILPVSVQDKFGNTVAQYIDENERNHFSLLRVYEFHMQIATQTIINYFIEAYRINKISALSIINFLNQTWIGDKVKKPRNEKDKDLSYLKLIEPGINAFFDELLKWKDNQNYIPNFITSTDSLILKAEYFLREFCKFLGIVTFKQNPKQQNIIMEKTLDDLLNDLNGKLSEDDHFFIKFILTEKAGYNLRNRVAHGLLDNFEYGIELPLFAIIILLKLSNYQLTAN